MINLVRGRVTLTVKQGDVSVHGGVEKTTYTHIMKTTSFFDKSQGRQYNLQSAAMLATPIVMFIGAWLSLVAWQRIMDLFPEEADAPEAGWLLSRGEGGNNPWEQRGSNNQYGSGESQNNQRRPGQGQQGFQSFAGQGHKLGS